MILVIAEHRDGKYFIYVGADKDLLRRAGFEFR